MILKLPRTVSVLDVPCRALLCVALIFQLIRKHLCLFGFCGKQKSGRWWKFITHSSGVTAHVVAARLRDRPKLYRLTVGIRSGEFGAMSEEARRTRWKASCPRH